MWHVSYQTLNCALIAGIRYMKILQPHQISSEVLEVIHSAQQYLILVSPYVKLTQWQQLAAALTAAKGRGVRIDFFVRNDPDNAGSWEQVEALGLKARLVSNLHAKFYFSETSGVISSMNLLASSNSNSIEIGCKLETQTELDELKSFVKRFVVPHEMSERPTEADLYLTKERFSVALEHYIADQTRRDARVTFQKDEFEIRAVSNTFFLYVDKATNRLFLSAIVSEAEAGAFEARRSTFFTSPSFRYDLDRGDRGHYSMVEGAYQPRLSTAYLDNLRLPEKKQLLAEVMTFIKSVRAFKDA
ncbi:hypothetical protein F1C16_20815 (plasmid) [Hymenobacter sp. NBH84]|uniref:PLD-like domain-containing protein n=2 Tax=Hymenobacter TaxID=89966 RepID=A0A1M6ZK52_9BACT|nr:hypothetical protein F1C16_20815 [Hymenobacter sp. NBH84]SHL30866.1 PLD-like domain-containing protein [Hymenobacter psychrotolerans DSM 18569]